MVPDTLKIIMLRVLETLFFYKKWNETLKILFSSKEYSFRRKAVISRKAVLYALITMLFGSRNPQAVF